MARSRSQFASARGPLPGGRAISPRGLNNARQIVELNDMTENRFARHLLEQVPGRGKRHASAVAAPDVQVNEFFDQPPATEGSLKSPRERDDHYNNVVCRTGGWRIIVCRDGIQWIIQRRRCAGRRQAEWKGKAYCTTRDSLIREWRRLSGADGAFLLAFLPERFGRQR